MKLSSVAAVFASLASFTTVVSAQGYVDSCEMNGFYYYEDPRPLYHVTCRAIDGSRKRTEMDLNLCVANNNGQLVPADGGNFLFSCIRCRPIGNNGADLNCRFCDPSGANPHFDLNSVLTNDDGVLRCFNHYGKPV